MPTLDHALRHPGLHPGDLYEQASSHPLSRFRFDTGSDHFAAECLYAAAVCATIDEVDAVEQRLVPALAAGSTDPTDAELRARTAIAVNALRPLPLEGLAAHPAPAVRQAAAVCWSIQTDRNPTLATIFARDSDRTVRSNLARELARLTDSDALAPGDTDILTRLAADPSARVRRATRSPTTSSDT